MTISLSVFHAWAHSLPPLNTTVTAQGWWVFLQVVSETGPSHLYVTKSGLMLLFLLSWLMQTAPYLGFPISQLIPWGDPKHCCQNLACIPPVTQLWLKLISEHHLPASWHAVFWSLLLLGLTYQQCQMFCQRGLSLGLSPLLTVPFDSSSSPKLASPSPATQPPWLAHWSECLCAPLLLQACLPQAPFQPDFDCIHDSTVKNVA